MCQDCCSTSVFITAETISLTGFLDFLQSHVMATALEEDIAPLSFRNTQSPFLHSLNCRAYISTKYLTLWRICHECLKWDVWISPQVWTSWFPCSPSFSLKLPHCFPRHPCPPASTDASCIWNSLLIVYRHVYRLTWTILLDFCMKKQCAKINSVVWLL